MKKMMTKRTIETMTGPHQPTPIPEGPFIEIPFNHEDYNIYVLMLQNMVDYTEREIERVRIQPNPGVTEYLMRSHLYLQSYQRQIKIALDTYDGLNKGGGGRPNMNSGLEDKIDDEENK